MTESMPPVTSCDVAIVGASVAGIAAASTLAAFASGATGAPASVVVLEAESGPHVPYDRPPLSSAMLAPAGPQVPDDLREQLGRDGWELRTGRLAIGLESGPDGLRILVEGPDGREELLARAVIVATGASPRRHGNAPVLHTLADSVDLRTRLEHAADDLVITGGGWIAAEAASAARSHGRSVTIRSRRPLLTGALGPLAVVVQDWANAAGVHLDRLAEPTADTRETAAPETRANGLWAIGTTPATAWIDPLPVARTATGALRTDTTGRVLDPALVPAAHGRLFAAGDAGDRSDGHWQFALESGAFAGAGAAALIGLPAATATPPGAPYAFTEIFGREIAVLGDPGEPDRPGETREVIMRGGGIDAARSPLVPGDQPDLPANADVYLLVSDDTLTGALTVDSPRLVMPLRRAIGTTVDAAVLADPGTPLRKALKRPRVR